MKVLFTVFLSFLFISSYSQFTKLEGTVELDSSDSPFGQFIVFSLPDSTLIKGSYIDSTYFSIEFDAIAGQDYYVKISLAGYADTLISFQAKPELTTLETVKFTASTLTTVDIVFKSLNLCEQWMALKSMFRELHYKHSLHYLMCSLHHQK
ncbi:MAG: hypothetical protein IPG07_04045 [Crocinitomicaceae bacterium]|nr:hypothetical protein [Crocinitomicaceae bacterium]